MTHTLARCRRLLATLCCVAALAVPAVLAAPAAVAAPAAGLLDAEILGLEPIVLVEGSDLVLEVRVTNGAAFAVDGATVRVLAQEWTPNTRTALTRWLDEDRYNATLMLHSEPLALLAPGATQTVVITVPATAFAFDAWGPRGIEVMASAPAAVDGARAETDRERTWVLWWNEPRVSPTGTGFLSPITPTVDELTAGTVDAARLTALLDQAATPGVTAVVDPAVLSQPDGARALPATAWILPWGNADSAAVLAAGRPDVLADQLARGTAAVEAAGATPAGTLDWPEAPDVATLAGTSGDVVVVEDDAVTPLTPRAWTQHAVGTLGERTAVVLDTGLGDALVGTAEVDGITFDLSPSQERQYVAAVTAVLTRERPNATRVVLAALPFDDDGADAELLAAVAGLPWVTATDLASALAVEERTALDATQLPAEPDLPASAVGAGDLAAMTAAQRSLAVTAEVVADPSLTEPYLADLALVPSATWREAPHIRGRQLADAVTAAGVAAAGLVILDSSTINMVSGSANFPVTITSTLPADAENVQVHLEPSEPWLQEIEPQTVTVPAGGEVTAQIPVRAVGWADFEVAVRLTTASGAQVGETVVIPVRVRADWENLGLTALVVGALLAFVVGIVRTVLRNRRTGRAAEIDAATHDLDELEAVQEHGAGP